MTVVQGVPNVRADSLRSVLDSVFAAPAYRWETPEDPFGPVRRAWLAVGGYLDRLREQNPSAARALTWVLVAVLVMILLHAAWVAVQTVRAGSRRALRDAMGPVSVPRDAAWFASEAQRLASEGRYADAMQADFLRLVLELDARRVTHFHPSKTPNEYVRDAALSDARRVELRELVRSLYAYAFARVPCGAADFDSWRQRTEVDRYAPSH